MPTLRARIWRVANCARKSAQREPGAASSGSEPVHEPIVEDRVGRSIVHIHVW